MPGTAAEILNDEMRLRWAICLKVRTKKWESIIKTTSLENTNYCDDDA